MDPNPVSLSTTQSAPLKEEDEVLVQSSLKDSSISTQFSSGTTSLPIRAPLSSDSDIETDVKINGGDKVSISSGFDSEEGFLSGEDEFETASERPFVADPDEETLDMVMERENIVPFVVETVVASSNSPSMGPLVPPKAQVTGDDDVVADEGFVSEVDDDGSSAVATVAASVNFPTVETPKAQVSGDDDVVADVGFVGDVEDDGFSNVANVPLVSLVESPEIAEDSKTIEDSSSIENPNSVENTDEGVLGSVEKEPSFENNSVSGLGSEELAGDGVSGVIESPVEDLVVNKEDTLPEIPKSSEQIAVLDVPKEDATETEVGVVVEKKIEVEDLVVETKHSVGVDENGVSDNKEVEIPVKKSVVLDSGDNQISPVIEELVKSELPVEDRDVNLSNAGDSLVETKQPILLEATGVEVVEEEKASETKTVEVLVEKSVGLGNESEQATVVVEEHTEPKLVEADIHVAIADAQSSPEKGSVEQNFNPVNNSIIEILEPYNDKSKTDAGEVEKDGDDDEKSAGSVPVVPEELETEPDTGSGAKPIESVLKLAANGVASKPSNDVYGVDETQIEDSNTVTAESDSVQEAKLPAVAAEESKHIDNGDESENAISSDLLSSESAIPRSVLDPEVKQESEDEVDQDFGEEDEDSVSDEGTEGIIFDGSETAEQIMKELERGSGVSSHSGGESSQDRFQRIDGQIVMDSDEEVDTDEEGDGKELFDSAALAALLKAASSAGSDGGSVTITSSDGSRLFSVERPAGLGSSIRSLKPAPRTTRPNLFTPSDLTVGGESENNLSEEEKRKLEKIQLIRVKFLRLVQRLGHSPEDSIAAQVLYRLVLAAGRQTSQTFSLDAARRTAMQLEAEGKDDLDFSLNILVLGKTGVGKSATINSIFGEEKARIDPFEPGTTEVKEIMGTVDGVKVRVFDTPGLRSSLMEQAFNQKVLSSVKKFTKKNPPDILLYVDRLDTQTRDLNDMPLLRSITTTLGSSIWRSAIVTLTHAASAPPDGPTGSPLSYEMFVGQRSHVVQQSIGQAVGDLRMMNPSLMNPVSLVENHPSCRRNREGHRVLPNGQTWKPQLLLLCYSMKILSEASSLSKPQDPFDHRKLFGFRVRTPPLPYLLSSLLQSRAHPKLPTDQGAENADSDIDLGDLSESDQEEEEEEYDQLPPFKPLRKSQIAKLSKEQRKAYFDEYDYRVKLLQKKQWREELKRMREMKKKGGKDSNDEFGFMGEDAEQENGGPAAVPVPLPDMVLPPSFDGDNPAYRYRFLEPTSQLLARPVLDTHGWDHDCGYDGVSLEESLAIVGQFPAGVAVQITKDKKEFNIHLDSSVATKHGENGSTLAGFDIQTIGKQLAYVVRGETKFKNLKKNKTAAGVAVTFLGENVATGVKIEDQIAIGKRLILVGSTGTVRSQGDAAYGANLEARLKEKDFPIGQDQSTLGLSLMKWRGDLALGANLQTQFSVGRSSKMSVRVGLNNKLSGQITVRTSSSEQLQLALVGLLPIAISIYKTIWPGTGESYSAY
ncbi:AIG1 [Macleaya cordata]|uniref:AIG1 n=1 Tax=Macleaya cordata TaxID=56857 RepID=A0A200QWL5_MACCD|nr:AIG1 [Macleaya cordata]